MADFLLELLSEEIPARMQPRARDDLARLFAEELARAGLAAAAIETFATPRRLALIARGLPVATEAVTEELKGPRADAPPQALAGFLGKTGLTRDQLVERTDAKGNTVLFAVTDRPGRATAQVLAAAIPAIVRAFPWPKAMRWGAGSLRWVRPLHGIVALLGEEVVPCEVDGIAGGAATLGHRFHHPGRITIGSAADYAEKLRLCHVIVSAEERADIIRAGAAAVAADAGLSVVPDEGLVAENAGLTEWPVPLPGRFDPAFLDVPREVIQLTMRTNQKYFACVDGAGALAPAFVCTANIDAADGGALVAAGNEKVLSARLSDAKFFWEQDLRVPLAAQAEKLSGIVFHEKLGTVADKVERVAKLARWLVEEGIITSKPFPFRGRVGMGESGESHDASASLPRHPHPPAPSIEGEGELASLAEQAARLCKADLVTGMVGEFPELQGSIGGHLARAQGLPAEVADAIRDHYKPVPSKGEGPVGQGDAVPTAPVTVAVSLADKLDTLTRFFLIDERPTGSKDPFALRRAAIGIIALILTNDLRLRLADQAPGTTDFASFIIDRLKVQQREAGVRHDLIDAVFAAKNDHGAGEDDLVRLLARVHALQSFVSTEDGANLLAGYKRAANILRIEEKKDASPDGEDVPRPDPGPRRGTGEDEAPAETALVAALDAAGPAAARAVEAEDFTAAMSALATLRAPIDAFFEQVTVNDPDPATRAARLALLARIRDAVHRVADFSKIEG